MTSPRPGVPGRSCGTDPRLLLAALKLGLLDKDARGLKCPDVLSSFGLSTSSGICFAAEPATSVRRTLSASLPKLKNEKKYCKLLAKIQIVTHAGEQTSSIAKLSSLSITRILHVSANSTTWLSSTSMTLSIGSEIFTLSPSL